MTDWMGVPVLTDESVVDGEVWITIEGEAPLDQEVVLADWGDGVWRLWLRLG